MMRTLQSFSCQYEQEYSYVISFMFEYTSPRECHGVRQFIPSMKLQNGHMAIGLVWVWSEVSSENRSEANGWNCNYGWTMANNLSNHTSAVSLKFDQVEKKLYERIAIALFSGSSESAQWRKTLQVSDMQQELHPAGPPAETLFGSHRGKASRMQGMSTQVKGLWRFCNYPACAFTLVNM